MNCTAQNNRIRHRAAAKLSSRRGFTMAEMLLAVALVIILLALVFITLTRHQRSLALLERDGIAKELFVAAQNHLTAAYGQGYPGVEGEGNYGYSDPDHEGVYYFVVINGNVDNAYRQMRDLILPFGSIDETVRSGGSYMIRYQPATGTVLDVLFWPGGSAKYPFQPSDDNDYRAVIDALAHKENRRDYGSSHAVFGWWGGAGTNGGPATDSPVVAELDLLAPLISIDNADKLSVTVTDTNSGNNANRDKYSLKLIITGKESKAQKAYTLLKSKESTETLDHSRLKSGTAYTLILDDITASGKHFCEIQADTEEKFIPGENITIRAVAYSTEVYSNIAYSAEQTTNSLFADGSTTTEARIVSFRHLENLDKTVSRLDMNDALVNGKLNIASAVQTGSLNWTGFCNGLVTIYGFDPGSLNPNEISTALTSESGYYYPIEPGYPLTYDGGGNSIAFVKADSGKINSGFARSHVGLFGSTTSVSKISNLELIDFQISGNTAAGALAGSLTNCTVCNVLARNSSGTSTAGITAPVAGGVIGTMSAATVQYSAAAVSVNGTTTAGGLIGEITGEDSEVSGCYSGGHTKNGSYVASRFDVSGGTAGGLIGKAGSAIVEYSYSTCSVSGTSAAGGFAGTANGSISNCYATGLIEANTATKHAFIGSGSALLSGNHYYRAINSVPKTGEGAKDGETEPMPPVNGGADLSEIKPIDLNADSYNNFVGTWNSRNTAKAFDAALVKYYSGRYTLKTVDELTNTAKPVGYSGWSDLFVSTHYGDWPSPEVFFINPS